MGAEKANADEEYAAPFRAVAVAVAAGVAAAAAAAAAATAEAGGAVPSSKSVVSDARADVISIALCLGCICVAPVLLRLLLTAASAASLRGSTGCRCCGMVNNRQDLRPVGNEHASGT